MEVNQEFLADLKTIKPEEGWMIEQLAQKYHAKYCSGVTRRAVVFPETRTVYKFPYYEETEHDYCAIELEKYLSAKKLGIDKILLPIERVGEIDETHAVYVQPMYTVNCYDSDGCFYRKKSNVSHDFGRKVVRSCYDTDLDLTWTRRAIQIYGKRFMKIFEKWTIEENVNDLHGANIGYLKRMPIICDYAGYFG